MSSDERFTTTVRFRRGRYKAVMEAADLTGVLSRDEMVNLLLGEGLAQLYARLGIERDPAATAAELLRAISATWAGDLSDEETAAIAVATAALDRIAQIRARESKTGRLMMTAQMDTLIEAAQAGFIPDGGTQLGAVLEAFPEFFRLLTEKLHELGAYIPGMGMSEEAGALVSDMAVHCGAAQEAASSTALTQLAAFLNGG